MALSDAGISDIVKRLPIPNPWNREAFVAQIARLRRRPIELVPVDTSTLLDGPCGLWLRRDADDLLLYTTGTSDYHRDHIVCHEIGHMVLGHSQALSYRADHDDSTEIRSILPDIDPATVQEVLARSAYSDDQEREAEAFANQVMVAANERTMARSVLRSVFLRGR